MRVDFIVAVAVLLLSTCFVTTLADADDNTKSAVTAAELEENAKLQGVDQLLAILQSHGEGSIASAVETMLACN